MRKLPVAKPHATDRHAFPYTLRPTSTRVLSDLAGRAAASSPTRQAGMPASFHVKHCHPLRRSLRPRRSTQILKLERPSGFGAFQAKVEEEMRMFASSFTSESAFRSSSIVPNHLPPGTKTATQSSQTPALEKEASGPPAQSVISPAADVDAKCEPRCRTGSRGSAEDDVSRETIRTWASAVQLHAASRGVPPPTIGGIALS